MSIILAAAAQFATLVQNDPITLEKQAAFGVMEDGHLFGLVCRPGKAEIEVVFVPDGYRGPWPSSAFFKAHADSRFGAQSSPQKDAWYFDQAGMYFIGQGTQLSGVKAKAEFIDNLAKDKEFSIRWEALPNDTHTITISYSLDIAELQNFIRQCGPKRVISRLKDMGSSAVSD